MAFKDFAVGEILTSSDVDTYLMSQVIIRCTSSTRPASPAQGWHIYETDTSKLMVYNGTSWVPQGGGFSYAYKASNESNTSSTIHTDAELVLPVAANTKYWFEAFVGVRMNSGGDTYTGMKWLPPSGATMLWASHHLVSDAPGSGSEGRLNAQVYTATSQINHYTIGSTGTAVYMKGTLSVGGTSGNFAFQWGADASGRTVLAGSFLKLTGLF